MFTLLLQLKFLVQMKSKWESCPATVSLPSLPRAFCPHACISLSSSLDISHTHTWGMTSSWSPCQHPHLTPRDSTISLESSVRMNESWAWSPALQCQAGVRGEWCTPVRSDRACFPPSSKIQLFLLACFKISNKPRFCGGGRKDTIF